MSYLINLAMKGRPAAVIGAGGVAGRKVVDLLEAGAAVAVTSTSASKEIALLAGESRIRLRLEPYSIESIRGAFLAIAATDDEELNARVSRDAQSLGILVNVVDRPALCTFTLPAVVRRGDFALGISTEGQCPALASILREELSAAFRLEWAKAVPALGAIRRQMVARGWSGEAIRAATRRLYDAGIVEKIWTGDQAELLRSVLGADFAQNRE